MTKILASLLLIAAAAMSAQQTLNNDIIVKMAKAGLSDDVIVATVNASAGSYNTSPDFLIALKTSGISDKVIATLIQKAQPVPAQTPAAPRTTAPPSAAAPSPSQIAQGKPRVYLSVQNSVDTWGAALHSQAVEMSRDLGQSCPDALITVNAQIADYTISLGRDNQMLVADRNGNVIAPPVKKETVAKAGKRACDVISSDWTAKYAQPLITTSRAPTTK